MSRTGRGERAWVPVAVSAATLVALAWSCSVTTRRPTLPDAVLASAPDATAVGSSACAECHPVEHEGARASVPGKLPGGDPDAERMCEACHGPGSAHVVEDGGESIFGGEDLAGLGARDRSRICLWCHREMASDWALRSPHDGKDVSCWDCHPDALHGNATVYDSLEHAVAPPSAAWDMDGGRFCLQCHWEVELEMRGVSHHPVLQGRMGCGDCHAVHGEQGGVESTPDGSEPCLRCHAEMQGPFIFEHMALWEGCGTCHLPHGSASPGLLVQDGSGLCLQCHMDTTFPFIGESGHAAFLGAGATCWQCHVEVHGSNVSETFAPGW